MAITNKLTAIGEAIREKSGKSALLTLDEMPTEIRALAVSSNAEEKLKASEYPDYITPEVIEVVNKVNAVRTDESIVFVAMSDSHYCADQVINFCETETNASTVQANQAAKALAYLIDADFFAHLGDVSCGAESTTPEMLKKQIEGFNSYFHEAKSDLPVFICIGNHDTGIYYHGAQTDGKIHTLDGNYLYNNFTAYSVSDNTVFGGEENGGYCYRDFDDKKLRVIMLNTSEKLIGGQVDQGTYGAQRVWLANTLLNLNEKDNAEEWGFIVLSHYPADYGGIKPLSQVFEAYVNGTSFIITDPVTDYYKGDKTEHSVDFSEKNSAKFIAQFHGHIHNFLVDKLFGGEVSSRTNGTPTEQYDAYRIAIPNGQYNRENTYRNNDPASTDGTTWGIKFFEGTFENPTKWTKTFDTAEGTSFVVNVINPTEQRIYSFCYGAGPRDNEGKSIERVISYGGTPIYNISSILKNVSISNGEKTTEEGKAYSATLTADNDYVIKTVTVTMGGVDITASYYNANTGEINIPEVTGNIRIEATAIFNFSGINELAISTDTDGSIYNGVGYKAGLYISSGEPTAGTPVNGASTDYTSGFIPCKKGEILCFKNCNFKYNQGHDRFGFYDENKNCLRYTVYSTSDAAHENFYDISYDEKGYINTFKIKNTYNEPYGEVAYIRFCCNGLDESSIVWKKMTKYGVSTSLNNVSISNNAIEIEKGQEYSATLTTADGYSLDTVIIKMGGVDITSTAYADGEIYIESVTDNIVIIATAYSLPKTNLGGQINGVNLSQCADSTDTYNNGLGYKDGYKITSTSSMGYESSLPGYVVTGWIPWKVVSGEVPAPIEIFGVTLNIEDTNCRLYCFRENKTAEYLYIEGGNSTGNTTGFRDAFDVTSISGGGYRLEPKREYWEQNKYTVFYIRLSLLGSGRDFVVNIIE